MHKRLCLPQDFEHAGLVPVDFAENNCVEQSADLLESKEKDQDKPHSLPILLASAEVVQDLLILNTIGQRPEFLRVRS